MKSPVRSSTWRTTTARTSPNRPRRPPTRRNPPAAPQPRRARRTPPARKSPRPRPRSPRSRRPVKRQRRRPQPAPTPARRCTRRLRWPRHAAGVLGAPKFGSKEDWAPRLKDSMDTVYNYALHGSGRDAAEGRVERVGRRREGRRRLHGQRGEVTRASAMPDNPGRIRAPGYRNLVDHARFATGPRHLALRAPRRVIGQPHKPVDSNRGSVRTPKPHTMQCGTRRLKRAPGSTLALPLVRSRHPVPRKQNASHGNSPDAHQAGQPMQRPCRLDLTVRPFPQAFPSLGGRTASTRTGKALHTYCRNRPCFAALLAA